MHELNLKSLQDSSEHLETLSRIFSNAPEKISAQQIRSCEKALVILEASFTQALAQQARHWKSSLQGLKILRLKHSLLLEKEEEVNAVLNKVKLLKNELGIWQELHDKKLKEDIIRLSQELTQFISQNGPISDESKALASLKRYGELYRFMEFVPSADTIFNSLFHFENKEKYLNEKMKSEDEKILLTEQENNVKRGIWIALFFSSLLITLPLTLPLIWSLLVRKKQLEKDLKKTELLLEKEKERLRLSDHGEVVHRRLQSSIGMDVTLDEVRLLLSEARQLNEEAHTSQENELGVRVFNFLAQNASTLEKIFGPMPVDNVRSLENLSWFELTTRYFLKKEKELLDLMSELEQRNNEKKQISRGYNLEILQNSIYHLEEEMSRSFPSLIQEELKKECIQLIIDLPDLLIESRELLYYLSRSYSVDKDVWEKTHWKLKGALNLFSLCALEHEYDLEFSNKELISHTHWNVNDMSTELADGDKKRYGF